MSDFDRIGAVFLKNIYATTKGRIRLAVLQRDLAPLLAGAPLRILDVGGGAGQMALWYASLGHEVVVADRSQVLLDEGRAAAQTRNDMMLCVPREGGGGLSDEESRIDCRALFRALLRLLP